jgi:hypothetical protein
MLYVSNLFEHNVTSFHHTDGENRGNEVKCFIIVEITISSVCCHSMQANLYNPSLPHIFILIALFDCNILKDAEFSLLHICKGLSLLFLTLS